MTKIEQIMKTSHVMYVNMFKDYCSLYCRPSGNKLLLISIGISNS